VNYPVASCFRFPKIEHAAMVARDRLTLPKVGYPSRLECPGRGKFIDRSQRVSAILPGFLQLRKQNLARMKHRKSRGEKGGGLPSFVHFRWHQQHRGYPVLRALCSPTTNLPPPEQVVENCEERRNSLVPRRSNEFSSAHGAILKTVPKPKAPRSSVVP
jgi:hypothetical protein